MERPRYGHVMLAVDFAPGGLGVGERAVDLARQHGARLTLLHVVGALDYAYAGEGDLYAGMDNLDLESSLVALAERELSVLADRLGVPNAQQRVAVGSPKEAISRLAEEWAVDLIVLGSHGRRGWAMLLGSTADAVLHLAKCDVLAVRIAG